PGCKTFDFYPSTSEHNIFYLFALSFFPVAIFQFLDFMPYGDKLRNRALWFVGIERGQEFLDGQLDGFTLRNSVPGQVNVVEKIFSVFSTRHVFKCFKGYAIATC